MTEGNLNITFLSEPILHWYLKCTGNVICFYERPKRKVSMCKEELLLGEAQPKHQLGHRGWSGAHG